MRDMIRFSYHSQNSSQLIFSSICHKIIRNQLLQSYWEALWFSEQLVLKLNAPELAVFFVGTSKKARIHPVPVLQVISIASTVQQSLETSNICASWYFMNQRTQLDCDVPACQTLLAAHFPFVKSTVLSLKAFG